MKGSKIFNLVVLCSLLAMGTAEAKLGGSYAGLENDRTALKKSQLRQSSTESLYSVYEMDSDGTTIREYAALDGTIFAVTWQGVAHPDLAVLLGTHYESYRSHRQAKRDDKKRVPGHQPSETKINNLVVRHGGHMRDLRGQAYLTDLVPAGVSVEELE